MRALIVLLVVALLLVSCANTPWSASVSAQPAQATASRVSDASTYLRPVDGVTYTRMSAEVERQLTLLVASNATTYAFREVGLSGTTVPIRAVVIQMTKAYAETKPLDELHGLGGPNSYPQRTVTSGIPTYLHSDATP